MNKRSLNRNPLNHGTNIHGRDEFGRKMIPELPWLPEVGPDGEVELGPSPLLKKIQIETRWPQLVLSHKDSYDYIKPSAFIGSAYRFEYDLYSVYLEKGTGSYRDNVFTCHFL